ncbi:NAD-dependent epimerase/dehydratase [Phytophthora palmivora]|uniref:NAD-dependent epimerase/dehydratase n=1 Tax=Phytophthora palmivora TaxID=4796 RepID=A0A2P4X594_9STRA|nr:NAD-dependent epimerase/dehydratase [Phytophthora palmivora]
MCDDEPAPADQVTAYACELLGVPVPPSQSWEEAEKNMSAMAKSFYAESKICVNRRIKEELGVKLIYPTYREGLLAQVLEEEKLARGEAVNGVFSSTTAVQRLVVTVNIGSLRAEPYLDLRQITFRLSRALGQPVVPCSFRFSNRVDPQELNGLEAKTFEMVLSEHLAARGKNASEIIVLPLFFGKSSTLTEFLPQTIKKVWAAAPDTSAPLTVRVGGCLVDQENANDTRVAQILLERIQEVVDFGTVNEDVTILVVDHGTPNRDVHESREFVAQELRGLLKPYQHVKLVDTACMERREGAEYDFNDPLLSVALDHFAVEKGIVVCAKMFFSNGRHAGEKGDIDQIIEDVRAKHPDVDVRVTEALGTHELVSEILHDRYRAVLSKEAPDFTLTENE